jgi:hypothetical protein
MLKHTLLLFFFVWHSHHPTTHDNKHVQYWAGLCRGSMFSAYIFLTTNSYTRVGFAEAIQGLSSVFTSFPAGWAADRFRRDGVLRVAGFCAFAAVHQRPLHALVVSVTCVVHVLCFSGVCSWRCNMPSLSWQTTSSGTSCAWCNVGGVT